MRVVSLLPSATELLAAAGAIDLLVGRSHECDFPSGLDRVPVLTSARTAFDPAAGVDAAEIDRQVKAQLKDGSGAVDGAVDGVIGGAVGGGGDVGDRSLYRLDTAALEACRPDLIITQDLCEVCSIDLGTVRDVVADMAQRLGYTPRVLSLNPTTVEGVFDDLLRVGQAVERERDAVHAVVGLRQRLHMAHEYVPTFHEGPVVGFLEWTDPLFVAGHWTVQLIERAGGRHPWNEGIPKPGSGGAIGPQMAERIAGKSIAVSDEVFAALRPEFLVICPCGLTLEQTRLATESLVERARAGGWWDDLPAVRAGRVALVDGNQHFNRPGPRLIDAFEWLVGWVQGRPEVMPAGFAWEAMA